MNKITESEAEMLAQKFAEKMQQARSVSDSEHYDHHRWISERIKQTEARRVFWEEMHKHVSKWGSVAILSFVFYGIWLAAKEAIHK